MRSSTDALVSSGGVLVAPALPLLPPAPVLVLPALPFLPPAPPLAAGVLIEPPRPLLPWLPAFGVLDVPPEPPPGAELSLPLPPPLPAFGVGLELDELQAVVSKAPRQSARVLRFGMRVRLRWLPVSAESLTVSDRPGLVNLCR